MSKTISVADDVYDWMKSEKGDRSFSELIRDLRKRNPDLESISGRKVTSMESMSKLGKAAEKASEKSKEKFRERFSS